uniref:Integrase catalytic domain-containing protein n=1 Tax=Heligmosomoides polygyrus TaxID=6339 RepID=A0A183GSG0_HELPZ
LSIYCEIPSSERFTKRTVARQIASVYDPFGWLVPLMTQPKRLQEDLWRHKIAWDEHLPDTLGTQWKNLIHNIDGFHHSVPRQVHAENEDLRLVVFADASAIALAACAYLVISQRSSLIMAKSKMPSIKSTATIPKLEMNAITIACRLGNSIVNALQARLLGKLCKIYIFSDSQIALSWLGINSHNAKLGRLVENRLQEIRRISEALQLQGISLEFRHVPTTDNPADAGTRGLTSDPKDQWTSAVYPLNTDCSHKEAPVVVTFTQEHLSPSESTSMPISSVIDCAGFSFFTAAKRTAVVMLIFLKKLLRPLASPRLQHVISIIPELGIVPDNLHQIGGLSMRAARQFIVRNHQQALFTREYRKSINSSLCLFQDDKGIWRSQGRFGKSSLRNDTKHPIVIKANTSLAELLIKEAHGCYHQGIEHTMATVRMQYWIPKLRQQVRKIVLNCVTCRRFNGLPYPYPDSTDLHNAGPLAYQGAVQEELTSIRPIDFLQRDLEITLPLDNAIVPVTADTDYHPPEEMKALQSQKEVLEALRSSCQATEKFWKIWHDQYLRDAQTNITSRRHGSIVPSVGDVVLITDPVLPRNDWKMARITETHAGSDGNIVKQSL